MKAIISKYHPAGNVRGARYSASDGDGNRVWITPHCGWDVGGCHEEAVKELCRRLGWKGRLVLGYLMKGGHQEARVWVWMTFYTGHPEAAFIGETITLE